MTIREIVMKQLHLFIVRIYDYFNNKIEAVKEELELERLKIKADIGRPKLYEYKLGSLSLSSSDEVSGNIVELFSLIKGDSNTWSLIHASDIAKAIKILKQAKENTNDC